MKDDTHMCRIKPQDWDSDKKEIRDRVRIPEFICEKCIRVSRTKSQLCKPKKIK